MSATVHTPSFGARNNPSEIQMNTFRMSKVASVSSIDNTVLYINNKNYAKTLKKTTIPIWRYHL